MRLKHLLLATFISLNLYNPVFAVTTPATLKENSYVGVLVLEDDGYALFKSAQTAMLSADEELRAMMLIATKAVNETHTAQELQVLNFKSVSKNVKKL